MIALTLLFVSSFALESIHLPEHFLNIQKTIQAAGAFAVNNIPHTFLYHIIINNKLIYNIYPLYVSIWSFRLEISIQIFLSPASKKIGAKSPPRHGHLWRLLASSSCHQSPSLHRLEWSQLLLQSYPRIDHPVEYRTSQQPHHCLQQCGYFFLQICVSGFIL